LKLRGSYLATSPVLLFIPSEKIKTYENPDDAEQIEFHLKTELEFDRAYINV
jgi:hypothetical protein